MMTMERKEQVEQAIVESFADVPYPGDDFIALDPTRYPGDKIQPDFKGQHWRDLPHEVVSRYDIIFLRPEARRFYWPAFLLAALDLLPERRVYRRLYALTPPEDSARFRREYDAYTPAQRRAIRLFLVYARDIIAEDQDIAALARLALERYWGEDDTRPSGDAPGVTVEQTRKEEIKQAIRGAFADVPYPGDAAIVPRHCDEEEEIRRDFKGYHWREVPHAVISYNYFALPLFSDKGIQFYLPAYILAGLEGDDETLTWVVYYLDPSNDDPDLVDWFRTRHDGFSAAQRHAVRLFLAYVRDEVDDEDLEMHARRALERYWAKDA